MKYPCQRCGKAEKVSTVAVWADEAQGPSYTNMVCTPCAKDLRNLLKDWFGEFKPPTPL